MAMEYKNINNMAIGKVCFTLGILFVITLFYLMSTIVQGLSSLAFIPYRAGNPVYAYSFFTYPLVHVRLVDFLRVLVHVGITGFIIEPKFDKRLLGCLCLFGVVSYALAYWYLVFCLQSSSYYPLYGGDSIVAVYTAILFGFCFYRSSALSLIAKYYCMFRLVTLFIFPVISVFVNRHLFGPMYISFYITLLLIFIIAVRIIKFSSIADDSTERQDEQSP